MTLTKENLDAEIDDFEIHLSPRGLSERTIYLYRFHLRKILIYLDRYGATQETIDRMLAKHNNYVFIATLKNYFKWRKIIDIEIQRPTGRKPQKIHATIKPDEFNAIYLSIKKNNLPKYVLMLLITYSAGLRRKEILNLKVDDFYFDDWLIDRKKNCKLKISVLGAKGKKERLVMIDPFIAKEVYNYVTEDRINKNKILHKDNFLFKLSYTMWDRIFRKACMDCKLYYEVEGRKVSKFTLHDLRRSVATEWFNKGKDIFTISKRLGHASISTTQRYINPDEERILNEWKNE